VKFKGWILVGDFPGWGRGTLEEREDKVTELSDTLLDTEKYILTITGVE
jgi:hypothetical protein